MGVFDELLWRSEKVVFFFLFCCDDGLCGLDMFADLEMSEFLKRISCELKICHSYESLFAGMCSC